MNVTTKNFYTKKEKIFLLFLFFAALVSLFFFLNFRTLAFPEHNIDFEISREQAAEKSRAFIETLGFKPEAYKEATVFSIDTAPKTYLEREVGVTETAKLAANDVALWQYTTRYFKPLEKEELTVSYLPNGRLSGYYRTIEESAPGKSLSTAEAKKAAETFLQKIIHVPPDAWILVNSERVERPMRVDYTFTWEKKNFTAAEATYRIDVFVYGDTLGGYVEYLKVPESWARAYEKETSNNDLAQTIAEALMLLLFGLTILITFLTQYRRNNLRIAPLRYIGFAAILISLLTALNSIPLAIANYSSSISWEGFIGAVILMSFLGAFFEGASLMVVLAAGEAKFRELYPKALSIESSIRHAIRTKEINKALFIGVFAGIIFFTYELVYYFLGKQIGFWAPADINYADMFSTYIPWVYPLFIGFMAAATEEGIFRLFGIPFLKKYLKSTWAAILITSVVWAFLHSNYPQSPWFVRGIEISVIGVVLGWLFVRYGFWASFTAHYTFNALQTAIYFFASGSFYASISSTAVSLLPLIIAIVLLIIAILKRGFIAEKDNYRNEHIIQKKESLPKIKERNKVIYTPLANSGKQYLIALSMLSLFLFWTFYPQTSLEQVPTSIGRKEVNDNADEILKKKGIAVDEYMRVTTFVPEDITYEEEYILEKKDFAALKNVYPEKLPLAHWTVRYFKPLEKNEYLVEVLPDGRVSQVVHVVDEKAQGANLSTIEAQKLAESYLVKEKGFSLRNYTLVENKVEKKENRTDHTLVFEEKGTRIGDAAFRTQVSIRGQEIAGFEQFLKLPESWLREKNETTTVDLLVGGLVALFGFMILWFSFRAFFELVRRKELSFRLAFKISAIVTGISSVAILNSLSVFYAAYDTAIPLVSYILQSSLMVIMGLVFSFFIFALIMATFIALWRQFNGYIFPDDKKLQQAYLNDALISGYSVPVILTGVSTVLMYILIKQDLLTSVATFDVFPDLDTFYPAITTLTDLPVAIGGACFIAISVLALKKYLQSWKRVLLSISSVAILLAFPQQRTSEDIAISIAQNMLLLFGFVLVSVFILRRNLLAYALMMYTSVLFGSGWVLFEQTNVFFKINGIVLLLLAILPVIGYGIFFWKKRLRSSS